MNNLRINMHEMKYPATVKFWKRIIDKATYNMSSAGKIYVNRGGIHLNNDQSNFLGSTENLEVANFQNV